jgi:hypothetical protein
MQSRNLPARRINALLTIFPPLPNHRLTTPVSNPHVTLASRGHINPKTNMYPMKKNIIAIAITAGVLTFAASTGLRAEDPKPTTTEDGGQCPDGGCHKGGKHHDKDGDKGEKPSPTPAQ